MHENGFWVFGYGSLIWNPGFPYLRRERAVLTDFHRSFCMTSVN
ncbi:MAG: gamma-glutamylcyclotransferase, partial [Pseudomonadota bacterium]